MPLTYRITAPTREPKQAKVLAAAEEFPTSLVMEDALTWTTTDGEAVRALSRTGAHVIATNALPRRIERLAQALDVMGHPDRLRILALLKTPPREWDGKASPNQLRLALGCSLGATAYHVRDLHKARLIRKAGERRVRGAVEHFYALNIDGEKALDVLKEAMGR